MNRALPYFIGITPHQAQPRLENDTKSDYLIVGGGIVGVVLAHYLIERRPDSRITLIEAGAIASGATGKSAGMICDVEERLLDRTSDATGLVREGVEEILRLSEGILCNHQQTGNLYFATKKEHVPRILQEYHSRGGKDGGAQLLSTEDVLNRTGIGSAHAGVFYDDGYQFNPVAFTRGLVKKLTEQGVHVYEQTPLHAIDTKEKLAKTPNGDISYNRLILTNGSGASRLGYVTRNMLFFEEFAAATVPLGTTADNIDTLNWWGSAEVFDFTYGRRVVHGNESRLLFGGVSDIISVEGLRKPPGTYKTERATRRLQQLLTDMFSQKIEIAHVWPGKLGFSPDAMPLAGFVDGHYFITAVTGLAQGVIGAKLLAGEILRNKDADSEPKEKYHLIDVNRQFTFVERLPTFSNREPFTTLANASAGLVSRILRWRR
jgi:gamma-glutamylputrescine oxidase